MAQSAVTVTPPNPTPPTNMSFLGTTPPTSPDQAVADDGSAGSLTAFAAKTASADNTNYPSVEAEARGTETVVTKVSGSGDQDYNPNTFLPLGTSQLVTVSVLGSYTATPNAQHASSLSPASSFGTISLSPSTSASGASGTYTQTVTGTGFTTQSKIWVNGTERTTTYVSSTSLTAVVTKKIWNGQESKGYREAYQG